MKQTIRLNERQLRQIVTESVKKVIRESVGDVRYYSDITYVHGYSVTGPDASTKQELLSKLNDLLEKEPDIVSINIYKSTKTHEGEDPDGWDDKYEREELEPLRGQGKDVGGFNNPDFRDWYRREYSSQN